MPTWRKLAAKVRHPSPKAPAKRSPKAAAAQTAATLRVLAATRVPTDRADKLSERIDQRLHHE